VSKKPTFAQTLSLFHFYTFPLFRFFSYIFSMQTDFAEIYDQLFAWCKKENFAGYDPFDGLNSRIFQAIPLKYFKYPRLVWLQTVKRSGKNLRPFLKVEKGINAKGIALFALAEFSRFRATNDEKHSENAKKLIEKLISLKIEIRNPQSAIRNRTAWGYNFDWQSRAFYAPQGTPTIVPTAFATQALIEAFEIFKDQKYLETARQICEFIIEDLNRIDETDDEVCLSYTPLDRTVVFNASLLAGECLAKVGVLSQTQSYLNLAEKTARYVVRRQRSDGAWAYGGKSFQSWVDNFHTAFVLLSLDRLQKLIPSLPSATENSIKIGLNYWLENFFLTDGTPKYYDRETFPIDIHSASAAIVALCELKDLDERCLPLAEKVATWTIENLRDADGFFYYQKRQNGLVKTPFIRWGQAWMAFGLAKLLENQ
jgi:hypothetical protein